MTTTTAAPVPPAPKPSSESPSALPEVPPLPWRTGMWVTLAALAWIAMGELDRLSGQVPDPLGRVQGFGDLMGLAATREGWTALDDSLIATTIGWWLACYVGLDALIILCYLRLGLWLHSRWPWPSRWIVLLAVVDVLEDGLAAIVAGLLLLDNGPPGALATLLVWVTRAKFVLLGLVIASFVQQLFRRRRDPDLRERDRSLWRAVYAQRFSLLTVLPVAVLSVVPGPDILDQLPDVQRRWAESAAATGRGVVAAMVLLWLAAGLFLLGRLRSDYVAAKRTDLSDQQAQQIIRPRLRSSNLLLWLIPAGLLLVLAGLAGVLDAGTIQWQSLLVFALVPTAVAALSLVIRVLRRPIKQSALPTSTPGRWWRIARDYLRSLTPPEKRPSTYADFRWVCLIGDLAAVTILVIGGLGLVRSFVAPAALADLPSITFRPLNLVILAVGIAASLAIWPVAARILPAVTLKQAPDPSRQKVRSTLTPGAANAIGPRAHALVAGASVLLLVAVAMLPLRLAALGGVITTTLLSIWALFLLFGSLVVLGQSRYSPELFWLPGLRLRSAPIASLLVAAVIVTAGTQVDIDVHPVRGAGVSDSAGGQPPLRAQIEPEQALQNWLSATAGCGRSVTAGGREVVLRPMPLVAAEGGGIRATYWTAAALDLMSGRSTLAADRTWQHGPEVDPCRTALFSGGASGGAVGLTVSRFAEQTAAREQVVAVSRSDALAQAVVGLFIRDTFYAATGVPLRAVPGPPGWSDRAALMEQSWEAAAPALAEPYLPADGTGATSSPTGVLLLNSTSVATGCRMLVSQMSLRTLGSATGPPDALDPSLTLDVNAPARATCDDTARPAPNSADLLATYSTLNPTRLSGTDGTSEGASSAAAAQTGCLQSLRSSTAALLASRFPYVTPSGVMGPCGAWPRQQFVDGGYVENTGISTIIDLAPWWLEQIRQRNEQELRTAGPIELVVPFVVYLDNGTGSDLAAPTYENTSEFLVPPLTILRSFDGQADTAALLQQAAALVDSERLWSRTAVPAKLASDLQTELDRWRPRPVVVVHQPTVPAVTAPLGWTLSDLSIDTMDRSLLQQADLDCETSSDLLCRRGYGSLADADRLFTG
jgi:hypothetical protein